MLQCALFVSQTERDSLDKDNIKQLIKEYKSGNNAALEKLMLLTYKDLYILAYSYLKDHGLAEDVVSETYVKLIEKIQTIKNEQNLNGYLRTIVINKSLDVIKKRKRESTAGEDMIEWQSENISGGAEDGYVRHILSMLSGTEREVLMLWQYGYTLSEISAKKNFTINQVRLILTKAKNNFSEKYQRK